MEMSILDTILAYVQLEHYVVHQFWQDSVPNSPKWLLFLTAKGFF